MQIKPYLRRIYHAVVGTLTGTLLEHYKGGIYRRIADATDSTNAPRIRCGESVVVYYSLREDKYMIRIRSEMYKIIPWPDGTCSMRFRQYSPIDAFVHVLLNA